MLSEPVAEVAEVASGLLATEVRADQELELAHAYAELEITLVRKSSRKELRIVAPPPAR